MKFLLESNNLIVLIAGGDIIWGNFENEDKWALYDENNQLFLYALDNNYHVEEYNGVLPDDNQIEGKYMYINGSLVVDPNWVAPPPTIEEQVESFSNDLGSDWRSTKIYKVGEYVMYNGILYICNIQNENCEPNKVNSPYWSAANVAAEFNKLTAMINNNNN